MAGTLVGGKETAKTIKRKYGADYYARNAPIGGRKGHTGGFAANRELARIAGRKGGLTPKRPRGQSK
jgi:hypothetical protein